MSDDDHLSEVRAVLDEDGDGAVDLSELYAEGCAAEPLPAGARGVTVTGREVNKRRRYLAKRRRADRVLAVRLVAALTRLDAVDLSFLTAPMPPAIGSDAQA